MGVAWWVTVWWCAGLALCLSAVRAFLWVGVVGMGVVVAGSGLGGSVRGDGVRGLVVRPDGSQELVWLPVGGCWRGCTG